MIEFVAIIRKDHENKLNKSLIKQLIDPVKKPHAGSIQYSMQGQAGGAVYDRFNEPGRFLYEDGRLFVLCDAEIYNYIDLSKDIKNSNFNEAQLVADLFLKHGRDWWKHINGPFSVFIWDKKSLEGFAYTDRIGIKPVVYYSDNENIIIASRIKCITSLPGFSKNLNKQAVFSYLLMEMIPTPFTIFKNVHKLESGYYLHVKDGEMSSHLYWKMRYPAQKIQDQKELETRIYDLTKEAVRLRVNYHSSVKEIGSFLSGGTDSSTISGLVNELYPNESKTFSIGFDEAGFDEMEYARIAAKVFGTDHTEYYVTPDDILNALPKIVDAYDEPFANSSVIPAYFCARLANDKGLKILLGGDGGDEIFGGNARYRDNFSNFARYPQWIMDMFWPLVKTVPESLRISVLKKAYNYMKRSKSPLHERIHAYGLYYYINPEDIFDRSFFNGKELLWPQHISKNYIQKAETNDTLDQYLFNDLKITLMDNDLRKVNRMAELANMSVRYPFLDHNLIEFTGLIPPDLKVRNGSLRFLFKSTFRNLLPQEIIEKKKHGFGLPVVPWMLKPGKLQGMLNDYLFGSKLAKRGIFRENFVKNLYELSLKDNTTFYGSYLYYLLFLEMWLTKHFDN